MERRSVCIIGCGVAGLVSAKVFLEDSDLFDVTVFEKSSYIGGLWAPDKAYPGLSLNSPKHTYAYTDFPNPDHFGEYPTAQEQYEYLMSYAQHFQLQKHIKLRVEVQSASLVNEKWDIVVNNIATSKTEKFTFDILIVATGIYHIPFTPKIENSQKFQGEIYHSSEVRDANIFKDKRVLVVGSGKSAVDIATASAHQKGSTTTSMVFRTPHYIVPRYLVGGRVSARFIALNRALGVITPYYRLSHLQNIVQYKTKPFCDFLWSRLCKMTLKETGLPTGHCVLPDYPVYSDVSAGIAPPHYFSFLMNGKIVAFKNEVAKFEGDGKGVIFKDGTKQEYDVVVFATGYQQRLPFFSDDLLERMQLPSTAQSGRTDAAPYRLYRHLIPIEGPKNIGFVGCLSIPQSSLAFELSAHWLTEYFLGYIELPSKYEMKHDVDDFLKFDKVVSRHGPSGNVIFAGFAYFDMLMNDMKLRTTRTSNFITEFFFPYYPSLYSTVQQEKVARRTNSNIKPPFYFGFSYFLILLLLVVYFFYTRIFH